MLPVQLCAVASSAAICVAVTYRLGSRRKDLDMKQIRTAEKVSSTCDLPGRAGT